MPNFGVIKSESSQACYAIVPAMEFGAFAVKAQLDCN